MGDDDDEKKGILLKTSQARKFALLTLLSSVAAIALLGYKDASDFMIIPCIVTIGLGVFMSIIAFYPQWAKKIAALVLVLLLLAFWVGGYLTNSLNGGTYLFLGIASLALLLFIAYSEDVLKVSKKEESKKDSTDDTSRVVYVQQSSSAKSTRGSASSRYY